MNEYRFSERQACRLLDLDRTSFRYEARGDRNAGLKEALLEWAQQKQRYGYRRLWAVLTKQGWKVNLKRVYRLYREAKLAVRRLKRKKLVRPVPVNAHLTAANQEWALDFVSDATASGRGLRMLTLVDSFTRECPVIEVNTGLSGQHVTRVLQRVIEDRGKPAVIRCDNGPEFTSRHFNGRLRDECLNANWFLNLADARRRIEDWRREYNGARPHSSLAYRTPEEYAQICADVQPTGPLYSRTAAVVTSVSAENWQGTRSDQESGCTKRADRRAAGIRLRQHGS
jgi:putative transposase